VRRRREGGHGRPARHGGFGRLLVGYQWGKPRHRILHRGPGSGFPATGGDGDGVIRSKKFNAFYPTDGDGVLALDGEDLREEMACWPAQRRRGVGRRRGGETGAAGEAKCGRRGPRRRSGERTEVFR
jgi:hypothetical protein